MDHGHDHLSGAASATRRLDPARRAALGLPPEGATPLAAALPPLDVAQWRDPEVVAARYVLVDTNHPAVEDPASLWARKATYASPRFAEDLRSSSSGAARLAELAAEDAVFQGEVIGMATVNRTDTTAMIAASVHRATAVPGSPPLRPRVALYRLTLVRHDDGRWLVVDVEVT
ncbi:MAG: hypothetical protein ACLGI2_02735 [Acidimicrobiia bacterium]